MRSMVVTWWLRQKMLWNRLACCWENVTATVIPCLMMTSSQWQHFPPYWPFVREIHRSPVNSPHKGPWRGALMFSLICVWINGWINNGEDGDLKRYRAYYDVTVMSHMIYPEYEGKHQRADSPKVPGSGTKYRELPIHTTSLKLLVKLCMEWTQPNMAVCLRQLYFLSSKWESTDWNTYFGNVNDKPGLCRNSISINNEPTISDNYYPRNRHTNITSHDEEVVKLLIRIVDRPTAA